MLHPVYVELRKTPMLQRGIFYIQLPSTPIGGTDLRGGLRIVWQHAITDFLDACILP